MLRLTRLCALLAAACAVGASVAAQSASFTTFGTGCSLPGAPGPVIGNRGLPRVGTTFTITYAGPNVMIFDLSDHPMLVAGASRIDFPVPPFTPFQPAGCTLYPALDVIVPMPPVAGGQRFETELDVSIPNDPTLLGVTVFLQWMTPHSQCFFVGCGLRWIVFSRAAQAVIGT